VSPGKIYAEAWDLYKRFWKHFIPIALVVFLVVAALSLILAVLLGWVGLILAALLSIAGTFWLQGAIAEAVADVRDGRVDLSIGDTLKKVSPKLARLIGAGLLAALGITLGLILLIVPGLILLTWWCLIAPVVVIERPGVGAAFGRSRELVRGNGWRVFGVIVVLFLIQGLLNQIITAIFGGDTFAGALIAGLISSALVAPLTGIAAAVVYLELRRLKGEAPVPAV